jgi:hypothetical protein
VWWAGVWEKRGGDELFTRLIADQAVEQGRGKRRRWREDFKE